MWRDLPAYSLVFLLSFCAFTLLFHTMANAQTSMFITAVPQDKYAVAKTVPSPTPFDRHQGVLAAIIKPKTSNTPTPKIQENIGSSVVLSPTPIDKISITPTKTSIPTPTHSIPTSTPTPTTIPSPTQQPTPPPPTISPTGIPATSTDLESLFTRYSDEYHVDKEQLRKIARCESTFNPNAVNGPYLGMFQFAPQTWISQRTTMGLDPNTDLRTNAEESIKTAAYMISKGGASAWAGCL
jgi:hypothetical protein